MKFLADTLKRYRAALENNKPPTTLFDDDFSKEQWRMLFADHRCPKCGSQLKFPPTKPKYAVCWGKRHGDRQPFLISKEKLFQGK